MVRDMFDRMMLTVNTRISIWRSNRAVREIKRGGCTMPDDKAPAEIPVGVRIALSVPPLMDGGRPLFTLYVPEGVPLTETDVLRIAHVIAAVAPGCALTSWTYAHRIAPSLQAALLNMSRMVRGA